MYHKFISMWSIAGDRIASLVIVMAGAEYVHRVKGVVMFIWIVYVKMDFLFDEKCDGG